VRLLEHNIVFLLGLLSFVFNGFDEAIVTWVKSRRCVIGY